MLTFNTLSAFKPQFKVNNKNASTNPTMNKNIRFGEEDDGGGDSFYSHSGREGIQDNYRRRLSELADLADDIEMDNETYYNQKRQIEREEEIALRNYDYIHSV